MNTQSIAHTITTTMAPIIASTTPWGKYAVSIAANHPILATITALVLTRLICNYCVIKAASRGWNRPIQWLVTLRLASVDAKDSLRTTALHYAAYHNHSDTIKTLVKLGADSEAVQSGYTALHLAAYMGHTDTVKALSKLGAKAGTQANKGETALHSAAYMGHTDTVKALLGLGAKAGTKDN